MKPSIFLVVAAASAITADQPRSYLMSIEGVVLRADESIDQFEVSTWGVQFIAVCHIPDDWEVTAGRFGPQGKLAGQSGHGASELRSHDMRKLVNLALLQVDGPIQKNAKTSATGIVPSTFSGFLNVQSGRDGSSRRLQVSVSNIKLIPASSCPPTR